MKFKDFSALIFFALALASSGFPAASALADTKTHAGKIVMMLNIVNKEYRAGIRNGQVINADEYGESQVFLAQGFERYQLIADAGKDPKAAGTIQNRFKALTQAIQGKQDPAQVAQAIATLNADLITQFGLKIEKTPPRPVSLENGKSIYQSKCVGCHGPAGLGDGPEAFQLDPPPARLADPELTGDALSEPYDNFQIISVGIANTGMKAWGDELTEQERWNVTYYIRSFANPNQKLPDGTAEAALPVAGGMGAQAAGSTGQVMADITALLNQAVGAYGRQDATQARLAAMDAYLTYEKIEPALINKDKELGLGLERAFGTLQGQIKQTAPAAEIQATVNTITEGLGRAQAVLEQRMGWQAQFWNSLAIIVREGFEAILIIAALITFLVKSKNPDQVSHIWTGVVVAVAASFLTAWLVESVLQISSASREQMEAWIMLFAVAMLFWVSYWLVSKVEAAKWQAYISGKMKQAIGTGSSFTLVLVAFISVYREGFETILFYKALYINAGEGAGGILPGFLAGAVVLAMVYFIIHKLGIRIPIKWFFVITSAFLAFMAFLFLGRGLHELQMGGALSMSPAGWAPEIGWLAMYPTWETFIGQVVLLGAYLFALAYTLTPKSGAGPIKAQTS